VAEVIYIALSGLGGLLFGSTVLFSDLLGGHLYSKTLQEFVVRREAREKRLGSVSRGLLGGLFLAAPVLILVSFLVGILALVRLVLPPPDSPLYWQVTRWSMAVGFIGGVVIRRRLAKRKPGK
jgi:hypothetical protein